MWQPKVDYLIKRNLPFVFPFPLKTFIPRLIKKFNAVAIDFRLRGLSRLGISKARQFGFTPDGNIILKLKFDSSLGVRGSQIQLPNDKIFKGQICRYGEWDTSDAEFLADGLNLKPNSAICDIGANSGLVSLQVMNQSKYPATCLLVEPIPIHVQAINHNFNDLKKIHNILVYEVALSDRNGIGQIFIQGNNRGNSSLFPEVVPKKKSISLPITLKSTRSFSEECLVNYENIVLKSDTQGMDAKILSRIPIPVWGSISRAVIEIWAIDSIEESEVDILLEAWKKFKYRSWSDESGVLTLQSIRNFWLSKNGYHKNLRLSV